MAKLCCIAALFALVTLGVCAQKQAHRVVIEVNIPSPMGFQTVLNNIENLKKAFAPEPVEVEVVCHGPGLDMIMKGGKAEARVKKVQKLGAVFAACANTMRGRKVTQAMLVPGAVVVKSGVYEVVTKQEAGWSYLKGAY